MREDWSHLDPYREKDGYYGTSPGKKYGKFRFKASGNRLIMVVADNGEESGWEHVSVSAWRHNTHWKKPTPEMPTWEDMRLIKSLFWAEEECVVEFHPPESEYVNNTENVLHLWKERGKEFPRPPKILV